MARRWRCSDAPSGRPPRRRIASAARASAVRNPTWRSGWPGSVCRAPGSAGVGARRLRRPRHPGDPGRGGPGHRPPRPGAPTGLMIKEHRGGRPWRVRYYRSGSAASRLSRRTSTRRPSRGDHRGRRAAPERDHGRARPGTARRGRAGHRDRPGGRDPGVLRRELSGHPVVGRRGGTGARRLAAAADLVFAGPEEAALVSAATPPRPATFDDGEVLARGLAKLGPGTVVVKLGALGALALSGDQAHRAPARPVTVVDAVGAGDAFVAGYLSEARRRGRASPSACGWATVLGGTVCECARRLGGPAHPRRTERERTGTEDVVQMTSQRHRQRGAP